MFSNLGVSDELINKDLEWLKDALKGLTRRQRRIILDQYINSTNEYAIGIKEYNAFIRAFDNLEEDLE